MEPITISESDVLYGRGNSINYHGGNLYYIALIKQYREEYKCKKTSNVRKKGIAMHIIKLIKCQDPPGRFLVRKEHRNDGPAWIEQNDELSIIKKVTQALRENKEKYAGKLRKLAVIENCHHKNHDDDECSTSLKNKVVATTTTASILPDHDDEDNPRHRMEHQKPAKQQDPNNHEEIEATRKRKVDMTAGENERKRQVCRNAMAKMLNALLFLIINITSTLF